MGYETKCRVRVDDGSGKPRVADGTVLLETDDLIVRGDARVKVSRRDIRSVSRRAGVVTIAAATATVKLTLGEPAAAKWEQKLKEAPKRLIDKLDVKPNAKVWLLEIAQPELEAQLSERTSEVSRAKSARDRDVVFVGVDRDAHLSRIERALDAILDDGAIWVIHPKGREGVADTSIFGKAKALNLTYTKVARVSDTHTAEKLVRPRTSRGKRGVEGGDR
jgi:biopolymer transport protein ExbD